MKVHNFTVYNDKAIYEKITSDMEAVKEQILTVFAGNVVAILLAGGFGRGEGGVLLDGNRASVVNDYDLHLITRGRIDPQRLKALSTKLSQDLGVEHVDIVAQPSYTLLLLKNTQYGYDLKHGSYLVYGDGKIQVKLPDSKHLPPSEIEKQLFTRTWCFLGPAHIALLQDRVSAEDEFFFLSQLNKAILGLEESILIHHDDYCSSYIEKFRKISKYCKDERTLRHFERATAFKLRPNLHTGMKNRTAFYFEVKDLFYQGMLPLINEGYHQHFTNWVEYAKWYPKRVGVQFFFLLRFLWNRDTSYSNLARVRLAQMLLANAITENGFDGELVEYAEDILHNIVPSEAPQDLKAKWWWLRDMALKLLDNYM